MGEPDFTGIDLSGGPRLARALSLALCLGLAGCGLQAARQPEVAHAPVGAHLIHTALPDRQPVLSCEELITAASLNQADPGPWDAATIEYIRRSLGYTAR